jgi:hypothetical protein
MVAPADATVAVVQGLDKCRTPALNVDVGEHVAPGATKVHGTSAAAAVLASTNAAAAVATRTNVFISTSF